MGYRKAHGTQAHAGPVVIEVMPADELPRINQDDIDARKAAREKVGRPFKKGNKAGGKKPKLAKLGLKSEDPKWKDVIRVSESYRKTRIREFQINFGYVSIAVRALVATAALQLGCSRRMMEMAMEQGDMDLVKKASAMANESRQNELAAWELCSREGGAKAKAAVNLAPWMTGANGEEIPVRVRVSETSQDPLAASEPSADNSECQRDVSPAPNSESQEDLDYEQEPEREGKQESIG